MITVIAASLMPKSRNGKKRPPIVKSWREGNISGMGMTLLSDCTRTYSIEEIVAVCMTAKSDHP